MDDKQRSQGLKAIGKVRVAAEAASSELEDIIENGCGAPRQVASAQSRIDKIKVLAHEAHGFIAKAHIVEADEEKGPALPFAGGPEATKVPKAKKDGKSAASGEKDDE